MTDDVSPRELMEDAAKIGDWIRELRSLEYQQNLEAQTQRVAALSELDPKVALTDIEGNLLAYRLDRELRESNPSRWDRIRFLRVEVEAALARGRLVEMAAVAERYV